MRSFLSGRSPFSGRWPLLAFGFAFAFFSCFGQTSFIAVFGGAIRTEFDLSHGAWGALYFLATLASGLSILRVGALIDAVPLRRYAIAVVTGLGLAAALMAATPHPLMLIVSLFLLRFFGQGLMTHVAVTSMAREFAEARGRAVAVAIMGIPAGEAIFPVLGTLALTAFGWRGGWAVAALFCFLIVLPLGPLLLRGQGRHVAATPAPFAAFRFLAQRDMLLALPALMATGFVTTAIFFHQVLIAGSKGWPPALFASSFAVFGASSIAAALASGWMVDRIGARRLAPLFLLPMGAACLLLAAVDAPIVLFVSMALVAASGGAYGPVTTSLLAEAYGVERLGSIRATAAAVMVVSTSLSPMIFGVLVDAGIPVDALLAALGFVALTAAALIRFSGLTRPAPA
jgi:MFS family permease